MRTYVPRQGEVTSDWWVVDAAGKTLGRLSTEVATLLRGKHKPQFSPFQDIGDHVVVVNADRVVLTGRKWQQKRYHRHSGYPGGIKEITAEKLRDRHPVRLVEFAIWGMLPKGPLGRKIYRKLKVYAGDKHPHDAQRPKVREIPGAVRADR